jgi:hypothetical protein
VHHVHPVPVPVVVPTVAQPQVVVAPAPTVISGNPSTTVISTPAGTNVHTTTVHPGVTMQPVLKSNTTTVVAPTPLNNTVPVVAALNPPKTTVSVVKDSPVPAVKTETTHEVTHVPVLTPSIIHSTTASLPIVVTPAQVAIAAQNASTSLVQPGFK